MNKEIKLPLTEKILEGLRTGDSILLTGILYTARDITHRRIFEALEQGKPLPFDIKGQVIYYTGPTPARPGQVIGSSGPTTSNRMDVYTPRLITEGLKGMIGKGARSQAVKDAIKQYRAVYMAAIGGTGALISKTIKKSEVIAYPELGAEAMHRLEVVYFPATVINDIYGGDLYQEGKGRYRIISK